MHALIAGMILALNIFVATEVLPSPDLEPWQKFALAIATNLTALVLGALVMRSRSTSNRSRPARGGARKSAGSK